MNLGGAGGTTRGDEEEQAKETKEGQSVSKEGKTKTKKKGYLEVKWKNKF